MTMIPRNHTCYTLPLPIPSPFPSLAYTSSSSAFTFPTLAPINPILDRSSPTASSISPHELVLGALGVAVGLVGIGVAVLQLWRMRESHIVMEQVESGVVTNYKL
ncbi:hypothetical protein BU24DRAFT_449530 [Aaosphaeria arxii CBS 175.79]|uniref:Uncharacterized protein n=1 Tax=Aaosphaeria arxii CBS 175.79 TaxID=1450172 RepID=A0A6A5XZ48_9PLEO|nr:uncharacterized protein BU24DRAFT_449530 [Aaosphaeria arxii CBS 175.79]KAF2017971.1 hypothetical protein BU24DRAFT_449530 [Aaosphaeria arxii CBS 175.79]